MSDHTSDSSEFPVIRIPLTQNKETVIDVKNADLAELKWQARLSHSNFYAFRLNHSAGKKTLLHLHRVILERKLGRPLRKGEVCDHINGNGLDNREENLRVATNDQNLSNRKRAKHNRRGYKGIYHDIRRGKWRAEICANKIRYRLGSFDTPEEAHEAYKVAAKELHGEFANFGDNPKGGQHG